jgi:putative glutathione S-transferase
MIDGVWHKGDVAATRDGRFVRAETQFRQHVTADGSSGFPAESGRYHLYVSLACPWAHRTLIFRALKGLTEVVGVSVVDPYMRDKGWEFSDGPGCIPDPVFGAKCLHEIYGHAKSDYSGRVTVPVLWDKAQGTIVNNESSEIIRMFNSAFDAHGNAAADYYPEALRAEIERVNERVYHAINNGVYRTGFAVTQEAYEEAFIELFQALDWVEARLSGTRYLCGEALTEADWRLFPTLIRFDAVYVGHFKCNLRRIADYPNLSNYVRELYQVPGVPETCDFAQIKEHYYGSHRSINPTGIVPKGPLLDFAAPHDRGRIPSRRP